jgi:hypothetical protein
MEKMTIVELKQVADQKGIAYASKIKKADLIALLQTGSKTPKGKKVDKFSGEY